ncbi:hypothetical protein DM793_18660 [Paenarthrobacter nitroguajacolicus]|uniref:hypothetical protein n=1 Tax=Paenarthrobacter nitroguajacolicus TaxID=211146 RepID=UPI0015BE037F|nr:hypothetical protein [Paenarthrobacter nitroguajacolicus]NWL13290.1 hypothetical protein [Paenarthrobacter nitroguajacolicus]
MKFGAGDTVRVINRTCKYFDQVATVQEVMAGQQLPFGLSGLETVPVWFAPYELILAEKEDSR